jgi:hypothetical protein
MPRKPLSPPRQGQVASPLESLGFSESPLDSLAKENTTGTPELILWRSWGWSWAARPLLLPNCAVGWSAWTRIARRCGRFALRRFCDRRSSAGGWPGARRVARNYRGRPRAMTAPVRGRGRIRLGFETTPSPETRARAVPVRRPMRHRGPAAPARPRRSRRGTSPARC